jgi:serine/threonine-protein kinase RsbW/sigma-B regulation protein RsbU (phosphoserine phosphatase)
VSGVTESIEVPGRPGELRRLHAFLGAFWERHALPLDDAMRVELGLEEVFINAVTHGLGSDRVLASGDDPMVTVDLHLAEDRLEVAIEDPGPPFDPLSVEPADVAAPLEARGVGGLGIHLVRNLLDDVCYERRDGRNRLVMVARLSRDGAV